MGCNQLRVFEAMNSDWDMATATPRQTAATPPRWQANLSTGRPPSLSELGASACPWAAGGVSSGFTADARRWAWPGDGTTHLVTSWLSHQAESATEAAKWDFDQPTTTGRSS